MKYFANIHNADDLRKAYRAHVITMHPDRGGNEEEFKAMQAEFETLKKQYQNGTAYTYESRHTETAEERARREAEEAREREEWARWEAEEKARREQEEREKAERIRKAQEVSRAAVRAWAGILERVAADATGQKARFYRFNDKKEAAAFVATTKRNIKAVINHYFPGLKVAVSISGRIWREEFTISWQDGPSIKELRDTCKELAYFVPSYYESDPYADYGDYRERESSAPWREAYGQALGDVTKIEYTRGLSDEGKQEAEALAARYFANFDPKSDADKFAANLEEFGNLAKAAGFDGEDLTNIFRTITGQYYADLCGYWSDITGDVNRRDLRKVLAEHVRVNVTPKEKAPEFVPTYGPIYKAIKKALGANVFYIETKDSRKNAANELNIFEAAERLACGEAVQMGHKSEWDGEPVIYGTDRGGYKTQQKRAAKFEAVGIILEGTCFNTYGHINAQGIKAETLEALRREREDIERQRKEWEQEQAAKASQQADNGKKAAKADNTKQENREAVTANEGNGDGLRMEKYSEKATVIRGYNEQQAAELEAMGGKEWRNLRGGNGYIFSTRRHADELAEWMKAQQGEGTTAPAADEPTAESEPEAANLSPVLQAFADVLRIFAGIMQQAKQWEGVTIPAATLARWKQEAEDGTKTAAARLCEVCACLASLTPENRRDFDALGVIFWTLSEQLRQGFNAETIGTATDYARAQLFDLIERTQTPQQAAKVREAFQDFREAA